MCIYFYEHLVRKNRSDENGQSRDTDNIGTRHRTHTEQKQIVVYKSEGNDCYLSKTYVNLHPISDHLQTVQKSLVDEGILITACISLLTFYLASSITKVNCQATQIVSRLLKPAIALSLILYFPGKGVMVFRFFLNDLT